MAAPQAAIARSQNRALSAFISGPTLRRDYCPHPTEELEQLNPKIDMVRRVLQQTDVGSTERPDLLAQLAGALVARSWHYRRQLFRLDEQIRLLQGTGGVTRVQPLQAQRAAPIASIRNDQKEAIELYGQAIRSTADQPTAQHQFLPKTILELACLQLQSGAAEHAYSNLKLLVGQYPEDRLALHAYGLLGEHAYARGDYPAAIQLYHNGLRLLSPVYGYSLYKEAWAQLKQENHKDAQATFVDVINYASTPEKAFDGLVDEGLARAAREGAAISYVQASNVNVEDAWSFARSAGREQAAPMMELMAKFYRELGRLAESNQLYRKLVLVNPVQSQQCVWQLALARGLLTASQRQPTNELLNELKRLAGISETLESLHFLTTDVIGACRRETAELLAEAAQVWHAAGVGGAPRATLDAAAQIYLLYLRTFPSAPNSNDLRYQYAELLSWLGDHGTDGDRPHSCQSAERFRELVRAEPKGPLAERAASELIATTKRCVEVPSTSADLDYREALRKRRLQYPGSAKLDSRAGAGSTVEPIPEKWQKVLSAYAIYIAIATNSTKLAAIKFARASIYYSLNHLSEASAALEDIVVQHPTSEVAGGSAILWTDCYEALFDADRTRTAPNVLQMGRQLEGMHEAALRAGNAEVRSAMAAARCTLDFHRAKLTEQAADYPAAAVAYEQVAGRCPMYFRSPAALFKSMEQWERIKQLDRAVRVAEALVARYKTDPSARAALYKLADFYEILENPSLAAEKLEQFAALYPRTAGEVAKGSDPGPAVALYRATRLRRQLPQRDGLYLSDVQQFVRQYGGLDVYADMAAELWIDMALLLEEQGELARVKQSLTDYLDVWPKKGAVDWQIVANAKLGELQWRESCPHAELDRLCVTAHPDPKITDALLSAIKACKQQLPLFTQKVPHLPERREFKFLRRADNRRLNNAAALFNSKRVKSALARLRTQRDGAERVRRATYYAALAKLLILDANYEQFRSEHRYQAVDYSSIIRVGDSFFKIAAMARAGQYQLDLALDSLTRTTWPAHPVVCTAAVRQPLDFIAQAKVRFASCSKSAQASELQSSWSKLCQQQALLLQAIE